MRGPNSAAEEVRVSAVIGSDPDQLDQLAATMLACADRLDDVRSELAFVLAGSPWQGGDADAARALEEQPGRLGAGGDGQVAALAHLLVQVAEGGGHALLAVDRDGDREVAVLEPPVLVRQVVEAGLAEGLGRTLDWYHTRLGDYL